MKTSNMKCILFFCAILVLLGVLNGYVIQDGTELSRGYTSNTGFSPYGPHYTSDLFDGSPGLFYGAPGLFYRPSEFSYYDGPSALTYESSGLPFGASGAPNGPFGSNYASTNEVPCNNPLTKEVVTDFRNRLFKFMVTMYKRAAVLNEGHFVFTLHTVWLTLAALAEGSNEETRKQLFSFLNLPEDRCLRQAFYQLCTTRESLSNDVVLVRNRFLITDSSVRTNKTWEHFARSQTNLNTLSVPFKNNQRSIEEIADLKPIFNVRLSNLNLNGNSFFLETMDYRVLWLSAFANAVIERGPFYNNFGEQVGTVDYMKIKQRVKIAQLPSYNKTILELPVGRDGRYKMIFAIFQDNQKFSNAANIIMEDSLFEILGNAKETPEPINIAIPKLAMTTEMDLRILLEELGIKDLWSDPSATRNISDPAALPSSYIQRVSIVIDESGFRTAGPNYPVDAVSNVYSGYSLQGILEIPSRQSPKQKVDTEYSNVVSTPRELELPSTESPEQTVDTEYSNVDSTPRELELPSTESSEQKRDTEYSNVVSTPKELELLSTESPEQTVDTEYSNVVSTPRELEIASTESSEQKRDTEYSNVVSTPSVLKLSSTESPEQKIDTEYSNVVSTPRELELPSAESSKQKRDTEYSNVVSTPSVLELPSTESPEQKVNTVYTNVVSIPSSTESPTDFVANRPYLFGLFDSETYTCLFACTFSKPDNYNKS